MVVIKECGESLVEIKKHCRGILVDFSSQEMKRFGKAYLRKTVVKKICQAKQYLPKRTAFVIRDAWRPKHIQIILFYRLVKKFSKEYPSWNKAKIIKEVKKYVCPWQGKYASGHMTGGAVDIRLIRKGKKLPMNSSVLSYEENSKFDQEKIPEHLKRNRQAMFRALKKVGFSNHPGEYWHWSYGDIYWAKRESRGVAIYGIVEDID